MLKRTDYTEKRRFGRRQTYIRAWVKIAGRPSLPCIVRDLSEGGALLEFEGEVWLPYSFRVTSEDKEIDRVCEIRHQNANRAGVEFVDTAPMFEGNQNHAFSHEDAATWMGLTGPSARR